MTELSVYLHDGDGYLIQVSLYCVGSQIKFFYSRGALIQVMVLARHFRR